MNKCGIHRLVYAGTTVRDCNPASDLILLYYCSIDNLHQWSNWQERICNNHMAGYIHIDREQHVNVLIEEVSTYLSCVFIGMQTI